MPVDKTSATVANQASSPAALAANADSVFVGGTVGLLLWKKVCGVVKPALDQLGERLASRCASVPSAGDVNGDGLSDSIVEPHRAGSVTVRSYVVFGRTDMAEVNLAAVAMGMGGFAINGATAGIFRGGCVSSVGDVNGDGLSDLVVGGLDAGRNYVVFGKTDTAQVNLSAVAAGTGGFVINGQCSGGFAASSVPMPAACPKPQVPHQPAPGNLQPDRCAEMA